VFITRKLHINFTYLLKNSIYFFREKKILQMIQKMETVSYIVSL